MISTLIDFNSEAAEIARQLSTSHQSSAEFVDSQKNLPMHQRLDMRLRNLSNKLSSLSASFITPPVDEMIGQRAPFLQLSLATSALQKSTDLIRQRSLESQDSFEPDLINSHSNSANDLHQVLQLEFDSPRKSELLEKLENLQFVIGQLIPNELQIQSEVLNEVVNLAQEICTLLSDVNSPIFDPNLVALGMKDAIQIMRNKLASETPISSFSLALQELARNSELIANKLKAADPLLHSAERDEVERFDNWANDQVAEAERLLKRDYSCELELFENQIVNLETGCKNFYDKVKDGDVRAVLELQAYLALQFLRHFPDKFETLFERGLPEIVKPTIAWAREQFADPEHSELLQLNYISYLNSSNSVSDSEVVASHNDAISRLASVMVNTAQSQMQLMSRFVNVIQKRRSVETINLRQNCDLHALGTPEEFDGMFRCALVGDFPDIAKKYLAEPVFSTLSEGYVRALFSYFADRNRMIEVRNIFASGRLPIDEVVNYALNPSNPQALSVLNILLNDIGFYGFLNDQHIERIVKYATSPENPDLFARVLNSTNISFVGEAGLGWLTYMNILENLERFTAVYEKAQLTQDQYLQLLCDVVQMTEHPEITSFLVTRELFRQINSEQLNRVFSDAVADEGLELIDFLVTKFPEELINSIRIEEHLFGLFGARKYKKIRRVFSNPNLLQVMNKDLIISYIDNIVRVPPEHRANFSGILETLIGHGTFAEVSIAVKMDLIRACISVNNETALLLFLEAPHFESVRGAAIEELNAISRERDGIIQDFGFEGPPAQDPNLRRARDSSDEMNNQERPTKTQKRGHDPDRK